jgi:hypothetical protein
VPTKDSKTRRAFFVLIQWFVEIRVEVRSAITPFIRRERPATPGSGQQR